MGQVQTVDEAAIGGDSAEATARSTTQAEDCRVLTAADEEPAATTSTRREEAPPDAAADPPPGPAEPSAEPEATSKTALPSRVEMGDVAAKARSGRRAARTAEGFGGNAPASVPRPRSKEQRGDRQGRPRTRRTHRSRLSRTPTPVALMVPGALATSNEPAPAPLALTPSEDEEMAIGHVSPLAPRATVVAGGTRWWRVACTATILGCFVVIVAMLAYGTIKSVGHQDRVIEHFENWTLARIARRASPANASTTSEITAVATSTADAVTFEEVDGSSSTANHAQSVRV
ncbi:uncharacterized protein [Dermacentor albipictus]|uniref:uncharacterized protein n=1 Tax=Dermacentor albipictus TaxID=60249 RepID=UPI0038FC34C7